jgi:hypothetical protein
MNAIIKTHKKFKIGDVLSGNLGRFKFIKSYNGKVIEEGDWVKNMIMKSDTYGVNIIVRNIIGDNTYSAEVTHAKIGTGTTPPTESDTDLETPTAIGGGDPVILRGDEEVQSINIAHLEFFISDTDLPNGTYTEWGLFTGAFGVDEKMFTRAIISPSYSKATLQDTTVVHEVTINN